MLDPKLMNSLEVTFGRRLQDAKVRETLQVRVRMASILELISFLSQHGVHSVTLEIHGITVIASKLKLLEDFKPEVVGANGQDVPKNSDSCEYKECKYCGVMVGGYHKVNCMYAEIYNPILVTEEHIA